MPRKTLPELAAAASAKMWPGLLPGDGIRIKSARLWLAGHRANRLTAKERAVVQAARVWARCPEEDADRALMDAVKALERAKERK